MREYSMLAKRTTYPNDRNMSSPDIGSDGNRSAQSLTSNDFISESFRAIPSHHCQKRDLQIREESLDAENVRDIAMTTPSEIEWHLPPKEVELRRTVNAKSFGLKFDLKIIFEKRNEPPQLFLLVDRVKVGSPASQVLKRGDLILSVNGKPTHCECEVNKEEFVASVSSLTKSSDCLRLLIQSPRRRLQRLSGRISKQESAFCSRSTLGQCIAPSLQTRRSVRTYDLLSYLQLSESTHQASLLPKVPYSKVIVLGENNTILSKALLGCGSDKMKRIECFSKDSFILQNSQESCWERTFQVKSSSVTFRKWLRNAINLNQCLDSSTRRLIEAQLAPNDRRRGNMDYCGEKNHIYVDLFAPVHTDIRVGNLAASLLMTGNEVYVYEIPATRLLDEIQACLKEVRSFLSRIRTLAGPKAPVLLVVTYTSQSLDPQGCVEIGEALKRFFAKSFMTQLIHFDNALPCCFLRLDDPTLEDGSMISTDGLERSLTEEITNVNTPLATLRFKVMQLLWEQNHLTKYRVRFLRYLELFWRMTEKTGVHTFYFRREIKEACCIRCDTELSDFVTYLKLLGELSGEASHTRDRQQIFLRPSSLHSPLTKMLSGTSNEPHLREEWNRLETTGIASSVLLREIFDDFDECSVIPYLQRLGILYPLSSLAAQSLAIPLPKNRDDSYNLMTTVSTSAAHCQCYLPSEHSLRIKFSGWIPTGFLVNLVLKMIDNLNCAAIRWRVCQSGCYEVNTGTDCSLLFQEDMLSASIKISTSFDEIYQPNYLLQLVIRTTKEIATPEDERPIVGCDCPLAHSKHKDEMHVLDLSKEHNQDIICGKQRLNEHPRLLVWLVENVPPREMPNLTHSRFVDQVPIVTSTADNLINLNPEVYKWLCDKLNVLDSATQRDWRRVAANLGFSKEDIDIFGHPRPDWNPCHRLFERWKQTGMATISRLMQILEEVGRKDIVCELNKKCWSLPNTYTV